MITIDRGSGLANTDGQDRQKGLVFEAAGRQTDKTAQEPSSLHMLCGVKEGQWDSAFGHGNSQVFDPDARGSPTHQTSPTPSRLLP